MKTGSARVLVRSGYSDFDSYGNGNLYHAVGGIIDAPDYMPQGSVRSEYRGYRQSLAHRDGEQRARRWGHVHDGQTDNILK